MKPTAHLSSKKKRLTTHVFNHKLQRIRNQQIFKLVHHDQYHSLTRREREILKLLASDFNNPEIAQCLHISRFTVEHHRKKINAKLGINSMVQLYRYALAFDLV
ncbi:LuxR C-terminal-related transcriptional regulator [Fulvivirga sp.]|uniref:response regulator transcription factor n=1 Tax=Fulvivirga sp. TaxID=1931237 RepID=UPI0032EC0515